MRDVIENCCAALGFGVLIAGALSWITILEAVAR
jgi:hypothetical protein